MKTSLYCAVLLLALGPARLAAQLSIPPEVAKYGTPDVLYINGKIVSMDDQGYNNSPGHIYEAMAIKGGRIMGLGTAAQMRALADSQTKIMDLNGLTVIPGIVETHSHMFGGDVGLQMGIRQPDTGINVNVDAGRDMETTRLRVENGIREAVSRVKPGEWVRMQINPNPAEGISSNRIFSWVERGELEPRERINRLATENPVMVQQASRATMNDAAWALVEKYLPDFIDYEGQEVADVPDAVEKGLITVGAMTAITWDIWFRNQPISLLAEMVRKQWEQAAAHGITTFSSRVHNPRIMSTVSLLHREGQMPIRFGALYEVHRRPGDPDFIRKFYTMSGNLTGVGDDWLFIHGVASELWDSSFPQGCLGPDLEAPPQIKMREKCPKPGEMYWDTLQAAMESGWRLAGVHGVASHGVRLFTQLIERAMQNAKLTVEDVRRLRPTIEHAEALGNVPELMAKLKQYGIIISANPPRLVREREYIQDYGPRAEAFMFPVKSWLDEGMTVVGQFEGYHGIGTHFNRFITREANGRVVLPDQKLDRVVVLKLFTTWAGQYMYKEKEIGTLEVGKYADFVALDKDFFSIPVNQIPKIRPQLTVVGGLIRHLEESLAAQMGLQPVGYQFPANYNPWETAGDLEQPTGGG